jgi:REP element-mobilizing transposase RayT
MYAKQWSNLEHGGIVRKGKRKQKRFLDVKRPIHLVMRSTLARRNWSFIHPRNKGMIHLLLIDTAVRYKIRIYEYVNVGNHIHLVVQGRSREKLQAFFKVFTQRVMFQVTGARKGQPRGRFYDEIIYSRVSEWGSAFVRLIEYMWKNKLESLGFSRNTIISWRKASREVPL